MTTEFEFHPHPAALPPIDPNTCHDIAIGIAYAIAGGLACVFAWVILTG